MRKTKLKNDSFWQAGTLPFVALWAGSYAAAWMGVLPFIEWIEDISDFSPQIVSNIAIAFILFLTALLHVQIVERLLKHSMRRWMLYSIVGMLITFFTFRDSSMSGTDHTAMLVTSLSLLVPMPLIQTVWLWRRVKAAWLWPLASVVAAMVFVLPLRGGGGGDGLVILAALLHGIVQGGIMRYLWAQPKDTDKAKVDFAENQEMQHTEHLQEIERSNPVWDTDDDQVMQKNAR